MRWLLLGSLILGMVAGGVVVGLVQQHRVDGLRTDLSDLRAEYYERVTDAQQRNLEVQAQAKRENDRVAKVSQGLADQLEALQQKANDAEVQYQVQLAAADDDADGLRQQLAQLADRVGAGDQAGEHAQLAGKRPAAGLAHLLAELDDLAQASAVAADRAIRRGLTCEAAYDRARVTTSSQPVSAR